MTDLDPILQADEVLEADAPALWAALSPLGRRLRQPVNFLPLQSAEARGKPFNATIGQITDGKGSAVPLPAMLAGLEDLEPAERSQAFLYSPVEGLATLRRAWRAWQRRGIPDALPSTLPLVTDGIAHARGLALQLFVPPGRTVLACRVEENAALRELVEVRLEGNLVEIQARGRAIAEALEPALAALPEGEPAVVLLERPPAGAGGAVLPSPERSGPLAQVLLRQAAFRPLVVACDDRWEPLEAPTSLFWSVSGRTPNLVPVKMEGTEGTWGLPDYQVGFLTFAMREESAAARALESKLKMLLRAEVGSPSSYTQVLFARELRERSAAS